MARCGVDRFAQLAVSRLVHQLRRSSVAIFRGCTLSRLAVRHRVIHSRAAASSAWDKVCPPHDAAWRPDLVTVIEVVCLRIVEVDGALHEAEAEYPGVEVDVSLRIAGDGSD